MLAGVWAGALVLARPAQAATVIIVRPESSTAAMDETVVRLRGELASVGFSTEILAAPPEKADARGWLERFAARRGAEAVVAFIGVGEPTSVEVWVIDKLTGKSVVRSVPFDPGTERGPERLAIRALELLRSSFVEIDLRTFDDRGTPEQPPAAVVEFVQAAKRTRAERVSVEAGGAGVMSLDGIGPFFLPMVDAGLTVGNRLSFHVGVAGFGSRAGVEGGSGSADVSQAYGLVGSRLRFRPSEWLQPFVGLGAGVLRTAAEGRGGDGFDGHFTSQWSFVIDAGAGLALSLRDRLYLRLGLHAQVAQPYPAIRFAGTVMATAARPNLLLTVTAGAWL